MEKDINLIKLRQKSMMAYFLMQRLKTNIGNSNINGALITELQKKLYKILFDNITVEEIQRIVDVKINENKLVNKIFIANGFYKIPQEEDFIFVQNFDEPLDIDFSFKFVRTNAGFVSDYIVQDSFINRLANHYKNELISLNELINARNNIFVNHQIQVNENADLQFINQILDVIYEIDNNSYMPNNKITQFLENYNPSKRLKKTRN